jgi:hypothetical protein
VNKIVSRETIEKSYLFTNNSVLAVNKQNYKNSPLERGRTRSGWGVLEESQNYNLKLKIKSIFSAFLNIPIIRRFWFKVDELRTYKSSPTLPYQGENLKNKIVSRETISKIIIQNIIQRCASWCIDQKRSLIFKAKRFLHFPIATVETTSRIVSRETIRPNPYIKLNYFLIAILISFLFIGLFDHYFWTLQQGRLMFWLVLGLILTNSNVTSKENRY